MALNRIFTGAKSLLKIGFAMAYNFSKLIRVARRYDVIYCATSDLRVIKRLLPFAQKNKKAIVHERTEYPDVFMPADSEKIKEYCRLVAQFDKVFIISTFIKHFFAERGVDEEKLQVYPMIVDPNRFAGLEKHNVGFRYVAYCGNLQNSKDGVADLIEAYGATEYAKNVFKLMLIGKKPTQEEMCIYQDMVKKYHWETGLFSQVRCSIMICLRF